MKRFAAATAIALLFPLSTVQATSPLFTVAVTSHTQSIARGAQRALVLTLSLDDMCKGGQSIDTITVHHSGLGSVRDIDRVYAMQNGKRITRTAVFREEGVAVLRFRSVMILDCKPFIVDIAVDFSPDAAVAAQHSFSIKQGSDVVLKSGDVPLLLPVEETGRTETAAGDTADSAIRVESLPLPFTLTYGSQRILARVRLDSEGRHEQSIRSITFTNRGSARDLNLQNIFLQRNNSTVLSEAVPGLDGRTVTLTLSPPLVLGTHDSVQLLLRGDVRASRKKTVQFVIEEPGDIDAAICTSGRTCDGAN